MSQTSNMDSAGVQSLLERDHETRVLRGAVERAASGNGSLVMVEGPAGIGKTRLLREVANIAEEAGLLVRGARGGEMERDLPFGVARQLFEGLVARASDEEKETLLSGSAQQALGALGHLEHDAPPRDSFGPVNGLYWLVANLSESRPTVLIIDDAHWSDIASLRFITFLARRLSDLSLLVILGIRTGEPNEPPELAPLRLEAERLQPQPLGRRSVHELITATAGHAPTERFSMTCATATGGNPFLVTEVLRELRSEGLELDDEAAISISRLAPENVATSVLFRLGRFGEEAISLARAIAVLGRVPQIRHVAALADVDEARARRLCDELRKAEILAAGAAVDFVHPLVRQTIYRELPEGERSASHRRAAELLDATGAAPLDVALHLLECAPNGDPWVSSKLQEAARVAVRRGAFESAVTFLERALLEPPEDELRVLSRLGAALIDTDPYRAADLLRDVVDRTKDDQIREFALRFQITVNQNIARLGEAARACGKVLALIGDENRDLVLALEAHRHLFGRVMGRMDEEGATRIDSLAQKADTETTGGRLIRQVAAWDRYCGCAPVGEVVALALPFPELPWMIAGFPSTVPFFAVMLLAWSGEWGEARDATRKWRHFIEHNERGWASAVSAGTAALSEVDRMSGRLHEAEANAKTAWEIARSIAPSSAFGGLSFASLAAALLARGDIVGFEDLMAAVELSSAMPGVSIRFGDVPDFFSPASTLEIKARGHLARGELQEGVEDLLALGDALEGSAWTNPAHPAWRQEATEALSALGRTPEAVKLITIAEDRARTFGAAHVMGTVLRARAHVEPNNKAIDTLLQSVEALEAHGPPHELARSLIDLGTALHRSGRRSEARRPLRRALELAHGSGAGGLERRARDELTATGARPRRLASTGPEALTATERQVAELAAEGLTNKEIAERMFVTTRTVETHLTHVYEKLSIRGRRHLAGALTTSGRQNP